MKHLHALYFLLMFMIISCCMESQAQNTKTINSQPLKLQIYTADEAGFGAASVIVTGNTDVVLVDAQFRLADAETVASEIKATGKKLTMIYVSHGDPDYYFGLQVFKKYFPEVTAYATAETIEHIKATVQKKLDVWGAKAGKAIATNIVLPQILKDSSIDLEGQKLEIIGLNEFPHRTFIWISCIKTVLGGINVFGDNFHLWMAEDKESTEVDPRSKWLIALKKIESLQPEIVIPAHANDSSSFNLKSVQFTAGYLQFYEQALKSNKTSNNLIKAIKERYPNQTGEMALQTGAKVNTGEITW